MDTFDYKMLINSQHLHKYIKFKYILVILHFKPYLKLKFSRLTIALIPTIGNITRATTHLSS
jgi:hypothetical protein